MRKVVILAGIVVATLGMFGVTTVRAASPTEGCTTWACIKCLPGSGVCTGPKSTPVSDTKNNG